MELLEQLAPDRRMELLEPLGPEPKTACLQLLGVYCLKRLVLARSSRTLQPGPAFFLQ
jgi:hypothetical protein